MVTRLELLLERRTSFINELIELNIYVENEALAEDQRELIKNHIIEVETILDDIDNKIQHLKAESK